MAVSPPPAPSSIDLSGLPPRVVEAAARVLALCREELRSEPRPEAPEEVSCGCVRPRTFARSSRGIHHIDMPATPARVWAALQGGGAVY